MNTVRKRITVIFMTIVTFGALLAPISSVFAGTVILGTPNQEYAIGEKHESKQDGKRYPSVTFTASDGTKSWGFLQEFKMDGELGFCVEPLTITHSGISSYAPIDVKAVLTPSTITLLNKIAWYGYGYNNDTSELALYATEVAVWEACGVSVSDITPTLRNKVNDIMNLVNNANTKLSFDKQTFILEGYGKENKITITDTTSQLSNWGNQITQSKGTIQYEVHENSIDIWSDIAFEDKEKLTFRQGTNSVVIPDATKPWEYKEMLAYQAPGYQTICRMGDPYQANSSIEVEVGKGNLELTKVNEVGDLLDGAVFNLQAESTGIIYNKDHIVTDGKIEIHDLYVGNYILSEVSSPDKHVVTTKSYDITITANETTKKIVVNKLQPTGKIHIVKSLESIKDEDSTVISEADTDITGITFQLQAKTDIYDSVTLQPLYRENEIVATGVTDEKGKVIIDNLPMGSYTLQETKTVDGYALDTTIYAITFRQEDYTTKEYTYTLDVTNHLTKTTFSKQDKDTGEELAGATLQIIDKETKEVIHTWRSDTKSYDVCGLTEGKEYILQEQTAPAGYNKAEDIVFIAGTKEIIIMQDEAILTNIKVKKIDVTTNESIIGKDFKFAMYADSACTQLLTEIDGDVTQGTAIFSNIRFGTVYIKEIEAPTGYLLSNEVKEIVIDENLENVGGTYTFTYSNTPIPTITTTGDTTDVVAYMMIGLSCIIIVYGAYRSKKIRK
jgi:uncharacterized surface anchored protein